MNVLDESVNISNRLTLLGAWQAKEIERARIILEEKELRDQVVSAFSDAAAYPESASGTESIDIGNRYDLKIVHKLNYSLEKANDCANLTAALKQIEDSVEGGSIIAERLVKWEPEIRVSEYNLLSPAHKAIIDRVLTIKPATKSLEIKLRGK